MSMPTPDNPHYVRRASYDLVYWSGNEASGPVGADRVRIEQNGWDAGEFKLPEQAAELERMERILQRAFQAGRKYQAALIREAMNP